MKRWSDELIQMVWEKGVVESGNDKRMFRKDLFTLWIKRDKYGDHSSQFGWEIERISPTGGDQLSNLRPIQWQNKVDRDNGASFWEPKTEDIYEVSFI